MCFSDKGSGAILLLYGVRRFIYASFFVVPFSSSLCLMIRHFRLRLFYYFSFCLFFMILATGDLPSVGGEISGDLPSTGVDASGSLPSGEVDVSMPSVSGAVEGAEAAAGDLSADVGAKVDDVAVKVPEMPSGEVKKPKKGRFGGLPGFKMPSSKKVEVSHTVLARTSLNSLLGCLLGWSFGRVCWGFFLVFFCGAGPCGRHVCFGTPFFLPYVRDTYQKKGRYSLSGILYRSVPKEKTVCLEIQHDLDQILMTYAHGGFISAQWCDYYALRVLIAGACTS